MRVRYGKPIKVESLLGKLDISTILTKATATNIIAVKQDGGSFQYGGGINVGKGIFNITTGHKYFYWADMSDISPSTTQYRRFSMWNKTANSYLAWIDATNVQSTNEYFAIWNSTATTEVYTTFYIGYESSVSNPTMMANKMIVIDLTEIGLDNLTAQQFYEKYHRYFPLIATGEEITIDDKAGQISISRLPNEYQEVEYIEGTGTQYMREWTLNKTYTGNLTVGYKFTATEHTDAMYFSTITANLSAGQAYSLGYTSTASQLYIRWNQIANDTTKVTYTIPEICEVSRTNAINNTTLVYVSLFCHSTNYKPWKGRIYKYWLKIDDDYIFDFIPCYRKSDNVIGLYDLVGKQFYTNQGTGTFLKGNNVNNTISCKVAGGQSDTYYNYNQQITHNNFDELGNWRIYMTSRSNLSVANNKATITSRESGDWPYEYGLAQSLEKAIEINHKYFVSAKVTTSYDTRVKFEINSNEGIFDDFVANTPKVIEGILTTPVWYENAMLIFPTSGFEPDKWFTVEEVNVFDLTDWFGAGNEPSTVAEIRNKFSKGYYDFLINPVKLTRHQIENQKGHNN